MLSPVRQTRMPSCVFRPYAGCVWRGFFQPRFPHRGLMIDLSRHFQPLASIRSMIDSLACVLFCVPAKQVSVRPGESKAK
jgi:hypothetical protein